MCHVLIPSLFDLVQPALDPVLNNGKKKKDLDERHKEKHQATP